MTDLKKVINGLDCCAKWMDEDCFDACNSCPYHSHFSYDDHGCLAELNYDAISLLKEQEAVKPKSKVRHGANPQIQHFCGKCNAMLYGKPKFCSECGVKFMWEGR